MVVEDEYIERQALTLMLRNNFPDIELAAEAGNGIDALRMAREKKPDIMLVDVGIPGISGLDLIAEIHGAYPDIGFIIISSHDNFEFAQRAIKLGVEDYLLKPARLEPLRAAMSAAFAKRESRESAGVRATSLLNRMEKVRPLVENDFIFGVISQGAAETLSQMLGFLESDVSCGYCLILEGPGDLGEINLLIKNLLLELGNHIVSGIFNNQLIICLMTTSGGKTGGKSGDIDVLSGYILTSLEKLKFNAINIGISAYAENISLWHEAYLQARGALKEAGEKGTRIVKYSGAAKGEPSFKDNLSRLKSSLSKAILDGEGEESENILKQISLSLVSDYNFPEAREEAYKFLVLLVQELIRAMPGTDLVFDADPELLKIEDPKLLEIFLLSKIKQLFLQVHETGEKSKNVFIDKAMQFIRENYNKDISLASIAGQINLSPFYLSKLFRRVTGKTCTDSITEERIKAAKKLLLKNFSSKETCYLVGFNSQNYFTRIFKKFTGLTPGEFRFAHSKEGGEPI
jgi:two-component system response regulator YesN